MIDHLRRVGLREVVVQPGPRGLAVEACSRPTWSCILHAAGKTLRRDRASSNRCHGAGMSQTHHSAMRAQPEIQGQGKALRESLKEGYRDALLVDHARPAF